MKEINVFACRVVHDCDNVDCFVRQMVVEKRSPWLFESAGVPRDESKLLRSPVTTPTIRVSGGPPNGLHVYCEDYRENTHDEPCIQNEIPITPLGTGP